MQEIGKIIERVVREKRWSVTDLAKKINTERANVYNIFKRKTIDTGLLKILSDVLEYNFFQYYIKEKIINKVYETNNYETNSEVQKLKNKIEMFEKEIKNLNDRLSDKETIIKLLQQNQKVLKK